MNGSTSLGGAMARPTVDRQTAASEIMINLQNLNEEAAKLHGRLSGQIERAYGPQPGTEGKNGPSPVPCGAVGSINEQLAVLRNRIAICHEQMSRIEDIV